VKFIKCNGRAGKYLDVYPALSFREEGKVFIEQWIYFGGNLKQKESK